ncbi:MAG: hypothetical protein U0793_09050 [Gemmataceae bacterium]
MTHILQIHSSLETVSGWAAEAVECLYTSQCRKGLGDRSQGDNTSWTRMPLEQEAKEIEARIRQAMEKEIAGLARLMVGKPDRELFGKTEFQVRDILLQVGTEFTKSICA